MFGTTMKSQILKGVEETIDEINSVSEKVARATDNRAHLMTDKIVVNISRHQSIINVKAKLIAEIHVSVMK